MYSSTEAPSLGILFCSFSCVSYTGEINKDSEARYELIHNCPDTSEFKWQALLSIS